MPTQRAPQGLCPFVNDLLGDPSASSKCPIQRESVRAACTRFTLRLAPPSSACSDSPAKLFASTLVATSTRKACWLSPLTLYNHRRCFSIFSAPAPLPVMQIGQPGHRRDRFAQRRGQPQNPPGTSDATQQPNVHLRGWQISPTFLGLAAQQILRDSPATGAVTAGDEVDAPLVHALYQPGSRVAPVQHQHIAGLQQIQLVRASVAPPRSQGPQPCAA